MRFQTKIQYLDPEPGRRLVVISDIHGHREWLQKLLSKIHFQESDILILLGDLIEKGPESLGTLRYAMELTEKYTVYPLMGNVDLWRLEMLMMEDGSLDEELLETNERMRRSWESTFFDELCRELSVEVYTLEETAAARRAIGEHFKPELDFLKSLPTILETPDFTFVHGGLIEKKVEDNLSYPPERLLKNDDFLNQGKSFEKYVVTGHWPVTLYRSDIDSSAPYISHEQKIISIDGGCGIKRDGQLNALLINGKDITWESQDGFPLAAALEDQEAEGDSINIRYFESKVLILKAGEEFSLARHLKSGRTLRIYNGFLDQEPAEGAICDCWEYTDYRLPVKKGETFSVIQETKEGCLVKKDGVTGWYYGRAGSLENAGCSDG